MAKAKKVEADAKKAVKTVKKTVKKAEPVVAEVTRGVFSHRGKH